MSTTPQSEAVVPPPAQYEFTNDQNQVIGNLAKKMRLVGIMLEVFGVVGAICGVALINRGGIATLIQGVIYVFLGYWVARAAEAFQRIVQTQGQDISHLMEALRQLGKYFGLQYTLIMIGLVLLALFLVMIVVVMIVGVGASVIH
jgi:hypothetical protein